MRIRVYGTKLDLAEELREEFVEEAEAAIGEAGDLLVAEVKRQLTIRSGTRRTAAPEGEPPERDTGDLVRSVKRISPRVKGNIASSGVRVRDPGANRLEFGKTDTQGIRTFPHPFVAPAMKATEQPITDLLRRRLGG